MGLHVERCGRPGLAYVRDHLHVDVEAGLARLIAESEAEEWFPGVVDMELVEFDATAREGGGT